MTELLTRFITESGWLAPLYYIAGYVLTALVPVVPTPLVTALGGAAFGVFPAIAYGVVGLGLGALVALNMARWVGRPMLLRLISPKTYGEWEALLGVRSPIVWGIVFFVLNVDIAVVAAGMSRASLRTLWITAMIARTPWLVAAAWLGEIVFVSDTVMFLALLGLIAGVVVFAKIRPRIQHWLVERVTRTDATGDAASALRRGARASQRRLTSSAGDAWGRWRARLAEGVRRARGALRFSRRPTPEVPPSSPEDVPLPAHTETLPVPPVDRHG